MEKHAFDLEQTLKKLVESIEKPEEIIKTLKQISESDLGINIQSTLSSDLQGIKLVPVIVQDAKSTSIFGPASIYNESLLIANEQQINEKNSVEHPKTMVANTKFNFSFRQCEIQPPKEVKSAVSLFFQFQYPSVFSFIHRESFLYYFLSNDYDNDFVSEDLVFAISALGSRMSRNKDLQLKSDYFYNHAKSLVFKSNENLCFTNETSITKLQTLLCLALYDIGRGNLTSGWLLSGLAFRIGFDFGFELDPKEWQILNLDQDNQGRVKKKLHADYPFPIHNVKSRIYWGCYIADNFVSLVLGRPTTLKLSDTNMPESEDMGDLTNIEEYMYHNPKTNVIQSAYPTIKALAELINLSNYILTSVFEPLSNLPQEQLNVEYSKRLKKLHFYNEKLLNWRSELPYALQWNRGNIENSCNDIFLHTHKCYFYIVSLCLNRPFIQLSVTMEEDYEISPISICDNIIDEIDVIVSGLETLKGIDSRAVGILLVFCIIISISILYIRFSILKDMNEKFEIESKLMKFSSFLDHCSTIWHVAKKPSEITKKRITNIWNDFNANRDKPIGQSRKKVLTTQDTFINVMDHLFNPNGGEIGNLSLLRHDLTSMDWDNLFDFDLNFNDVHST